jgi:hypothetical protein
VADRARTTAPNIGEHGGVLAPERHFFASLILVVAMSTGP